MLSNNHQKVVQCQMLHINSIKNGQINIKNGKNPFHQCVTVKSIDFKRVNKSSITYEHHEQVDFENYLLQCTHSPTYHMAISSSHSATAGKLPIPSENIGYKCATKHEESTSLSSSQSP